MKPKNTQITDALFIVWSEDREKGSAKPLQNWIAAYPEYADDLIAWTAAAPILDSAATAPADPVGEARAAQIGRRLVAEQRARLETPLASLLQTARARSLDKEILAAQLNLSVTLLIKLERRLLRVASLPGALLDRLADSLQVTTSQVRAYLSLAPTLSVRSRYQGEKTPQAWQQDFVEAIEDCEELTEAQKSYWKDTVKDQG